MNIHLRISNYIARYAPSEKKIREYISKKNHTFDISMLLQELGYSESLMIDLWIRTFIATTRGEYEMRQKLIKKGFPKSLIDERIQSWSSEIHDWESQKDQIEQKINILLDRGKSKIIAEQLLREKYPYFRNEIHTLFESKSETIGLEKDIEKYRLKYDISNPGEKIKFFQALARRGFSYQEVKKYLQERG